MRFRILPVLLLATAAVLRAQAPLFAPVPLVAATRAASPGDKALTLAAADRAAEMGFPAVAAELYRGLLAAPDRRTWMGRRDWVLLLVAIQTGLRNTEITSLRWQDVGIGVGAHVKCLGKGRKTRCTPLRPDVAEALQQWFAEQRGAPASPVFPSSRGGPLSADALQRLVIRHVSTAYESCPTLAKKHVTPHTLRHTAAMDLLRRGVDLSVIALWLGHESSETTQIYLHADMGIKEKALAHATLDGLVPGRYLPSDPLLAFLEGL